jgi:hypothetical protein
MDDESSSRDVSNVASPTTEHSPTVDQLLDPSILLSYLRRLATALLAAHVRDLDESFGPLDGVKTSAQQLCTSFIVDRDPLVLFLFKDEHSHEDGEYCG